MKKFLLFNCLFYITLVAVGQEPMVKETIGWSKTYTGLPDSVKNEESEIPKPEETAMKGQLAPCDNATDLVCGQTLTNQTTVGAGNDKSSYCVAATFSGPDKVYRVIIPDDTQVKFVLNMQTGVNLDMFLLNSNCSNNNF